MTIQRSGIAAAIAVVLHGLLLVLLISGVIEIQHKETEIPPVVVQLIEPPKPEPPKPEPPKPIPLKPEPPKPLPPKPEPPRPEQVQPRPETPAPTPTPACREPTWSVTRRPRTSR